MANMSYCKFNNTYGDLEECKYALEDFINGDSDAISSYEEAKKAKALIELCREIADSFDEADIEYNDEEEDED